FFYRFLLCWWCGYFFLWFVSRTKTLLSSLCSGEFLNFLHWFFIFDALKNNLSNLVTRFDAESLRTVVPKYNSDFSSVVHINYSCHYTESLHHYTASVSNSSIGSLGAPYGNS